VDEVNTITAVELTSGLNAGQFEIFVEDDAEAATTMYRWNPAQTVPAAGWTDGRHRRRLPQPRRLRLVQQHPLRPAATWTLNGSGTDIGGTSDQFNFASTLFTGDGSITAEVDSLSDTSAGANAGVMIRDSYLPTSMFADVVVTPSDGILFQWRSATGAGSSSTTVSGAVPEYVSISRTGNLYNRLLFHQWHFLDADRPADDPPSPPEPAEIHRFAGLAVTSQNATTLATAAFTKRRDRQSHDRQSPSMPPPIPVPGTSTTLNVTGADPSGTSTLTYTWATVGTPPAPITFSASGTKRRPEHDGRLHQGRQLHRPGNRHRQFRLQRQLDLRPHRRPDRHQHHDRAHRSSQRAIGQDAAVLLPACTISSAFYWPPSRRSPGHWRRLRRHASRPLACTRRLFLTTGSTASDIVTATAMGSSPRPPSTCTPPTEASALAARRRLAGTFDLPLALTGSPTHRAAPGRPSEDRLHFQ